MKDLKPCPFCGTRGDDMKIIDKHPAGFVSVYCYDCETIGPTGETDEEAVMLWNDRKDGE